MFIPSSRVGRSSPLVLASALLLLLAAGLAQAAPERSDIGGKELAFGTEDGVSLMGNVFSPPKGTDVRGAILFVHEPNRSSRDWAYMAEKMSRRGFVGMIFDLRGHGRSLFQGDEELDRELFGDEEFAAMSQDLDAALVQLRKAAGDVPVHIAGADLGASLALMEASGNQSVASVAMLSPGLAYDGINLYGSTGGYAHRPLLLVYSVEDGYARKSAEILAKQATGPVHTEVYYGVGHGTKMLAREPQLEVLLTSWFLGTVITVEGRALEDAGKPVANAKEVQAAQLDSKAERKRLAAEQKAEGKRRATGGVGDEDDRPAKRYSVDEK